MTDRISEARPSGGDDRGTRSISMGNGGRCTVKSSRGGKSGNVPESKSNSWRMQEETTSPVSVTPPIRRAGMQGSSGHPARRVLP